MRISDWSSDVCSSDLSCQLHQRSSCAVVKPGLGWLLGEPDAGHGVTRGEAREGLTAAGQERAHDAADRGIRADGPDGVRLTQVVALLGEAPVQVLVDEIGRAHV